MADSARAAENGEEGVHIAWLTPYALAFVGLFVAVLSAPGLVSAAAAVIVVVAMTVGAGYVGWRRGGGVFVLFVTLVPALFIAFMILPLQPVSGWMSGFACDPAHPLLAGLTEEVASDPIRGTSAATMIAQVCVSAAGDDPQPTVIPGLVWSAILFVWFLAALVVGVLAFGVRHPEEALAAVRR